MIPNRFKSSLPIDMVMDTAQERTGAGMDWNDAHAVLENGSQAETLDYLQDLSEAMGYDFGNIQFEPMPDHVGGYTKMSGTDANIYLNEALLSGDHQQHEDGLLSRLLGMGGNGIDFYDETHGLLDTFYHELVHGKQYRDIRQSDESYTEQDLDALLFLHEGQASYNADGASYRDAQTFYEELLESDGADGADALEDMMEDYRVDVVYMQDGDKIIYDFVVTDRDEDVSEGEIYELAEDAYGMSIDTEKSHEIDYRDMDMDKYMDHVLSVQDEIEEGYDTVREYMGEDALPTTYDEMVDQEPPSADMQYRGSGMARVEPGIQAEYCCS